MFSIYLQWFAGRRFFEGTSARCRPASGVLSTSPGIWVLPSLTLGLIFPCDLFAHHARLDARSAQISTTCGTRPAPQGPLMRPASITRHGAAQTPLLPMVTLIGLQAGTMLGGSRRGRERVFLAARGTWTGWLMNRWVQARSSTHLLGIVFVFGACWWIAGQFSSSISSMRGSTPRASPWTARMDAIKRYFSQSGPPVAGLILLVIVDRDGGPTAGLPLSARSGWALGRPAIDLAVSPIPRFPARHRQFRAAISQRKIFYGARISLLIGGGRHRDRGVLIGIPGRRFSQASMAARSTMC